MAKQNKHLEKKQGREYRRYQKDTLVGRRILFPTQLHIKLIFKIYCIKSRMEFR